MFIKEKDIEKYENVCLVNYQINGRIIDYYEVGRVKDIENNDGLLYVAPIKILGKRYRTNSGRKI